MGDGRTGVWNSLGSVPVLLVAVSGLVAQCITMGFTPEGLLPLFFFKKGLVEVDFDA